MLAGFVIAFGGVSWVVTGGFNTHAASARQVSAVPKPPHCGRDLEVVGAFSECAVAMPDQTTSCSLLNHDVEARLRFVGPQVFGLDISIEDSQSGTGSYALMPWPDGPSLLGGTPMVGVDEYSSDTVWQSVTGVLTVTSTNGNAGTVHAVLQASTATVVVPGPTISIVASWRCP